VLFRSNDAALCWGFALGSNCAKSFGSGTHLALLQRPGEVCMCGSGLLAIRRERKPSPLTVGEILQNPRHSSILGRPISKGFLRGLEVNRSD